VVRPGLQALSGAIYSFAHLGSVFGDRYARVIVLRRRKKPPRARGAVTAVAAATTSGPAGLAKHAPNARVVFDTFHIMRHLGDALDEVRRSEYRRLAGKDRAFIKGQRYTLLSRRENLSPTAERADSECRKGPTVIREDPFDIPM
jgi:transposase